MTGTEQVLIEDWCQQYPSHSIGDARVRPRRRPLRERRRRRELQLRRLRPGRAARSTPAATRRAASARRSTPPTAEGGALRSQDLRTAGDPTGLDGARPPRRPGDGRGASRQPAGGEPRSPTPAGSSPTGCATRSASPFARHERGLDRRRGLEHWEEIDRIPITDRARRRELRLALLRGRRPPTSGRLRRGQPDHLREPLRRRNRGGHGPVLHLRTTAPRSSPSETCPSGSSSVSGLAFAPASGGTYPAEYDGALFFADYSRDCIWAMLPSASGGLPDPASDPHLRRRRREPGRPPDRPRRRSLLRRLRRRDDPADHLYRRRTSRRRRSRPARRRPAPRP